MTENEYNKAEGIRRSDLWKLEDSPEKFKWFLEHPEEPGPALIFGSACHKMVLEPQDFLSEYAVAPNVDKRTKEGKEAWARFTEENEGKTVISSDQFITLTEMREALQKYPLAKKLMYGNGETETPFFWTDRETGEKCKVKLDRLIRIKRRFAVIDYKTTVSANTEKFNRSVFNYGYTLQAAMYTEAVMKTKRLKYRPAFIFVVQEKTAPYSVNIIQVSPEVMEYGLKQFRTLMDKYHTCKLLDEWNGYLPVGGGMNYTDLPGWVGFEDEDE